jgi:hypothetical protein
VTDKDGDKHLACVTRLGSKLEQLGERFILGLDECHLVLGSRHSGLRNREELQSARASRRLRILRRPQGRAMPWSGSPRSHERHTLHAAMVGCEGSEEGMSVTHNHVSIRDTFTSCHEARSDLDDWWNTCMNDIESDPEPEVEVVFRRRHGSNGQLLIAGVWVSCFSPRGSGPRGR